MSNHKARKSKEQSSAMQSAKINNLVYAYTEDQKFMEAFKNTSIRELHDRSHEFSILATKLRALAWRRQDQITTGN